MLLNSDKVSNEHHLSSTNEQADKKTESDSEAVSVNILLSSARGLSWALVTGRVCHQQHSQCFNKGVIILSSTWISFKVQLSSWNRGAVYRFCENIMSWWTGKGPESASRRHGSGMKTCVWGSSYDIQSQASVYNLQSKRLCVTFN